MDPPQKKQRCVNVRYELPFMSQAALAAVCRYSREHGLPEITSARDVRGERNDMCLTMTPYGTIHRTLELKMDGGDFTVEIQDPWAMLHHCLGASGWLSKLFLSRVQVYPPSPSNLWHLLLYSDEITPGNQIAHRHQRKTQSIYWSFLEFGPYLGDERLWFTAALIRSSTVNQLPGAMSKLKGELVKVFFPSTGPNMETSGIMVPLHKMGQDTQYQLHLFVEFGLNVEDELALHMTYMCMGASGLKPCVKCQLTFAGVS